MSIKFKYICCLFLLLTSCENPPTYHPFEGESNISIKKLMDGQCDTISAGCGYYNIYKGKSGFTPYYQVYQFEKVVAKGFKYDIDTIGIRTSNQIIKDSILHLPIDKSNMDSYLNKYGYRIHFVSENSIHIINKSDDIIKLPVRIDSLDNTRVIRRVEYYKSVE